MAKKIRIPKTMGACADLLFKTRRDRLKLAKAADALKADEVLIQEYIIKNLPKSRATGVSGKLATVTIKKKRIPVVVDWKKFYEHIRKTKNWDLMQRRLSNAAIEERWEAGKKVPGVDTHTIVSVGLSKI